MNAVITGGTKGIGRAIAEKFASEGFNVAVCARTKKDLDELYDDLHQKYPDAEILTQVCDVAEKKQLKSFADLILTEWNDVEVLVNNAGIFISGKIHKEKNASIEKIMKTNFYSAYYLTQFLLKRMIKDERGHIFNNCSVASIKPYEQGVLYGISKYALYGFSKNLRVELIPYHIKVTSIIAGATYTDSWAESGLPEKRFMRAEDIASAVWNAYTMSPESVVEEILMRPMKGDI